MKPETKERYLYTFATIIAVSILAIIAMLIFVPVPEANKAVLDILIGVLASAFTGIVGYFFGSSKGSADKTAIMSQTSAKLADDKTVADTVAADKVPPVPGA